MHFSRHPFLKRPELLGSSEAVMEPADVLYIPYRSALLLEGSASLEAFKKTWAEEQFEISDE